MAAKPDKKLAPFYDDGKAAPKRSKALMKWIDTVKEVPDVKAVYAKDFSLIYNTFLSTIQSYEKVKPKNLPTPEEGQRLLKLLKRFFQYNQELIHKKWQNRSIAGVLEQLLDSNTLQTYRSSGFDMLVDFLDCLDEPDPKALQLLVSGIDFTPFTRQFPADVPPAVVANPRLPFGHSGTPAAQEDSVDFLRALLQRVTDSSSTRFRFWITVLERSVFPVLFPMAMPPVPIGDQTPQGFNMGTPPALANVVAEHIAQWCSQEDRASAMYASEGYVNLVKEVAKQVLSNKQVEPEAVMAALKIYSSWIDGAPPPPMQQGPEMRNKYLRKVIRHSSKLLAEPREPAGSGGFASQVSLCRSVIQLYHELSCSPDAHTNLNEKTWSLIFSQIQAANKAFFSDKSWQGVSQVPDGTELELDLVECWFAVFFRARTSSETFWQSFQASLQATATNAHVIAQWKRCLVFVTRQVVTLLYGDGSRFAPSARHAIFDAEFQKRAEGQCSDAQPLSFELPDSIIVEKDLDKVMCYWQGLLHGLQNPADLKDPNCQSEALGGIAAVADMLLDPFWGSHTAGAPLNTILAFLGKYFFTACDNHTLEYSAGRCVAVRALSRIVCVTVPREDCVANAHLYEFFRVISDALSGPDTEVINAVTHYARDVFICDLPGASVLVPVALTALELSVHTSESVPAKQLMRSSQAMMVRPNETQQRASALHMINSMAGFPTGLAEISANLPGMGTCNMEDIRRHAFTVLDRCARIDDVTSLKSRALYGLTVVIVEDILNSEAENRLSTNSASAVKTLLDLAGDATDEVAISALDCLITLANYARVIEALVPGTGSLLVSTLCQYSLSDGISKRSQLHMRLLHCLREWLSAAPGLLTSEATSKAVFHVVYAAIESAQLDISEGGQMLGSHIMCSVASSFPSMERGTRASPEASEHNRHVHYLAGPSLIISYRECAGTDEVASVFVRDLLGLHQWNCRMVCDRDHRAKTKARTETVLTEVDDPPMSPVAASSGDAISGQMPSELPDEPYVIPEDQPPSYTDQQNTRVIDMLAEVHAFSKRHLPKIKPPINHEEVRRRAASEIEQDQQLAPLIERMRQLGEQQEAISQSEIAKDPPPAVEPPSREGKTADTPMHWVRVLMSHLCACSPWGQAGGRWLESNDALRDALDLLDEIPAREGRAIGLLFRTDTEAKHASPSLQTFVSRLGWRACDQDLPVDCAEPSANDRFYSDANTDCWFRCLSEFPNPQDEVDKAQSAAEKLQQHTSKGGDALQAFRKTIWQQGEQRRASQVAPHASEEASADRSRSFQRWSAALRVFVVWWDCKRKFTPPANSPGAPSQRVFIVIVPLQCNVSRIEVHCEWKGSTASKIGPPTEPPPFGPLLNGMVVSNRCLPALVRQTAIQADRLLFAQFDRADFLPYIPRAAAFRDMQAKMFKEPPCSTRPLLANLILGREPEVK